MTTQETLLHQKFHSFFPRAPFEHADLYYHAALLPKLLQAQGLQVIPLIGEVKLAVTSFVDVAAYILTNGPLQQERAASLANYSGQNQSAILGYDAKFGKLFRIFSQKNITHAFILNKEADIGYVPFWLRNFVSRVDLLSFIVNRFCDLQELIQLQCDALFEERVYTAKATDGSVETLQEMILQSEDVVVVVDENRYCGFFTANELSLLFCEGQLTGKNLGEVLQAHPNKSLKCKGPKHTTIRTVLEKMNEYKQGCFIVTRHHAVEGVVRLHRIYERSCDIYIPPVEKEDKQEHKARKRNKMFQHLLEEDWRTFLLFRRSAVPSIYPGTDCYQVLHTLRKEGTIVVLIAKREKKRSNAEGLFFVGKKIYGLISLHDLVVDLIGFYAKSERRPTPAQMLEHTFRTDPRTLMNISNQNACYGLPVDSSLKELLQLFAQPDVQLINLTLERASGSVRVIDGVGTTLILSFMVTTLGKYFPEVFGRPVSVLPHVPFETIHESKTVLEGFQAMIRAETNQIPVVNDQGVLVGSLAMKFFLLLMDDRGFPLIHLLDTPIKDFLLRDHPDAQDLCVPELVCLSPESSILQAVTQMTTHHTAVVYVVDKHHKVIQKINKHMIFGYVAETKPYPNVGEKIKQNPFVIEKTKKVAKKQFKKVFFPDKYETPEAPLKIPIVNDPITTKDAASVSPLVFKTPPDQISPRKLAQSTSADSLHGRKHRTSDKRKDDERPKSPREDKDKQPKSPRDKIRKTPSEETKLRKISSEETKLRHRQSSEKPSSALHRTSSGVVRKEEKEKDKPKTPRGSEKEDKPRRSSSSGGHKKEKEDKTLKSPRGEDRPRRQSSAGTVRDDKEKDALLRRPREEKKVPRESSKSPTRANEDDKFPSRSSHGMASSDHIPIQKNPFVDAAPPPRLVASECSRVSSEQVSPRRSMDQIINIRKILDTPSPRLSNEQVSPRKSFESPRSSPFDLDATAKSPFLPNPRRTSTDNRGRERSNSPLRDIRDTPTSPREDRDSPKKEREEVKPLVIVEQTESSSIPCKKTSKWSVLAELEQEDLIELST